MIEARRQKERDRQRAYYHANKIKKRKQARASYLRRRDQRLEEARKYRVQNQDKIKDYRRRTRELKRTKRMEKDYGLTVDDRQKLLETQGGGCAICGQIDGEEWKRLCVDHDHVTGEVRGLLCRKCNSGIGFLSDDPSFLKKAIGYLSVELV